MSTNSNDHALATKKEGSPLLSSYPDCVTFVNLVSIFYGLSDEGQIWDFVQFQIATKFTFDGTSCFLHSDLLSFCYPKQRYLKMV